MEERLQVTIGEQLNALKTPDIYSLMLFVLYKLNESDEYSSLSQLSYILDKDNLLKLCEFYGGTTIRIPTIEELEVVLSALFLYQAVNIQHKDFNTELNTFAENIEHRRSIVACYEKICEILKDYELKSGVVI